MGEGHYRGDNSYTKNEYTKKAIRFYADYLDAAGAGEYPPRVLSDVLEGYVEYMAIRPGAEQHDDHGLFGSQPVDLEAVMKEAEQHDGPVRTLIYFLRREDAARLGYDNAKGWQTLIKAHQVELATAMKIRQADTLLEGSDPELTFLYWLFKYKNVMPWEAYDHIRLPGPRDTAYAFASFECDGWAQQGGDELCRMRV